ncbi:hypothetical protein M1D58_27380 (plasmid) [Pseudomonas sp. R4-76]|uniref:hypothetical protein n=1 Tax=unclassified Pseudomonas TaxID=196821 RepID=UPI003DA99478
MSSDTDLIEVTRAVRANSTSVWLDCPHCMVESQHEASAYKGPNDSGVFVIAPIVTYGVVCGSCDGAFIFRPKAVDPVHSQQLVEFFQGLTFDPNGARDWPFTTEVEQLVTVAWLREFEDGTQQFMDADEEPPQVYSPRLTPDALERFCEANIEAYRAFHDSHEAALDRRESVPMIPFW